MNNRKVVRAIAVILAVVLAASLIVSAVSYIAMGASAETELQQLQEKANELETKEAEAEARINALEYEQLSVLDKKQVLDNQVVITEEKVNIYEQQLDACKRAEGEISQNIVLAEETESELLTVYGRRVRNIEENGIISYFSVIFNADSYFDLICRVEFFRDLLAGDQKAYTDYTKAGMDTKHCRERLTEVRDQQQVIQTYIDAARAELQEEAAYAASVFAEDISTAENYVRMCDEMESMQAGLDKRITDSVAETVRTSQTAVSEGTGTFIAPLKGTLITAESFGSLLNEEFSYYRRHRGADFSADYGAEVLAADRGVVTLTGYTTSYGNFVAVSHGSDYVTVYAHLGDIDVAEGEMVEQGQVIGSVGSTGAAAVPMLHFEIRYQDEPVNPMSYLEKSGDYHADSSQDDDSEDLYDPDYDDDAENDGYGG